MVFRPFVLWLLFHFTSTCHFPSMPCFSHLRAFAHATSFSWNAVLLDSWPTSSGAISSARTSSATSGCHFPFPQLFMDLSCIIGFMLLHYIGWFAHLSSTLDYELLEGTEGVGFASPGWVQPLALSKSSINVQMTDCKLGHCVCVRWTILPA